MALPAPTSALKLSTPSKTGVAKTGFSLRKAFGRSPNPLVSQSSLKERLSALNIKSTNTDSKTPLGVSNGKSNGASPSVEPKRDTLPSANGCDASPIEALHSRDTASNTPFANMSTNL